MSQSPTQPESGSATETGGYRAAAPNASRPVPARRLVRFAKKELLEILRDRRTIITLVLMPILVYPLMGIVIQRFTVLSILGTGTGDGAVEYRIAFENEEMEQRFVADLEWGYRVVNFEKRYRSRENANAATPGTEDQSPASNGNRPFPTGADTESEVGPIVLGILPGGKDVDVRDMVLEGVADVAVRALKGREQREKFAKYELIYRNNSAFSREVKKYVEEHLVASGRDWSVKATGPLMQLHVRRNQARPPEEREPFRLPPTFRTVDLSTESEAGASQTPSILAFVPLMLVLMTITGAVYPAIDLTAGERERGTMEILVAAPVSRMSLLFGKFVAVIVVAMLTAIFNMIAMLITVYTLGLDKAIFGEAGLTIGVASTVLLLLLVFAAFFSATLLGVTSFARSFKEAQAYLIPLMLIALAPGLIGLNSNLEMNLMLSIVPLLNIVLAARDLLAGDANWGLLTMAIISTVIYGLLAMGVAAKVFGADSVLAGGGSSWSDLFRRSAEQRSQPTLSAAMFFLAVLFPTFIVINSLATRGAGGIPEDAEGLKNLITRNLTINAVITFALFVLLPLVFAALLNLRRSTTFFFRSPPILGLVGAVLIGVSVWTLIYEVNIWILRPERIEALAEAFESMKLGMAEVGLPIKLVCLALVPAVCEELTFRGFLLSAFRRRMSALLAILATALLFGLFHVFVRDVLFFERLVPTTIMGILLGWICVRTGSIWPGMLLHVIHNGLMISIGHYESEIKSWGVDMADRQHLPTTWILIALVPLAIGLLLFALNRTRSSAGKPVD